MYLFAGLGNIGREYDGTRHNIGFAVVDLVETRLERSVGWRPGKGEYYYAKGILEGNDVVLVKPTTYMNLSGRAVRDALAFFKCEMSELIVICDDIALPLGTLRLRLRGSDGGHNGLSSVIYETGTDEFARLRCGVGSDFRRGEQARYVLSKFKSDEEEAASDMIARGADACESIVRKGVALAMNTVNLKGEN